MRRALLAAVAAALVPTALAAPAARARPLPEAPQCPTAPADSFWHADVSHLPVHPMSDAYVASIGLDGEVHADFGAGTWDGGPIGIPYTVVDAGTPRVPVRFTYASESDAGPYPIPRDARIEGGPRADGDRHVLVVDRSACVLYELYDAHPRPDGSWDAGSGAVFDLRSNALRPDGWTSADAAGLAILPGLVRYDEVAAGEVDHAIRVTARATQAAHLWPARHHAGSVDPALPPMGLRLRLRASVDPTTFPPAVQPIVRAMQRHGLIVADNGSSWFLSGTPDERWDDDVLRALHQLRGSDFEAVDTSTLVAERGSGRVRAGATAPPIDLERYVAAVYRDFLGRAPDDAGRAHWVGQLAAGLPRERFTGAVARSPEWLGTTVGRLYERALDRAPDAAGLAHWVGRLAAGAPVAELAAALHGSDEAYALAGATPEGFAARLYERVLGRAPDDAGRTFTVAAARAGVPRAELALALHQSEEHRAARVAGLYADLLDRAPDPGGHRYWTARLLRDDDVVLAALLAAGDEYATNAGG